MIVHADRLVLSRLLKALRKAHRTDTWLLKKIDFYLRVQCVLCGTLYKSLDERDRHQNVCQIRFLSLSYYFGQSINTLAPLQGLYAEEKQLALETDHALQQMHLLAEKVMEGQLFSGATRAANLAGAFAEEDESTSVDPAEGGSREEERGTREVLGSFQKVMMEETELDLMFRTDQDDPSSKASKENDEHFDVVDNSDYEGEEEEEDDKAEEPGYKRSETAGEPAVGDIVEIEPAVVEEGPAEILPSTSDLRECDTSAAEPAKKRRSKTAAVDEEGGKKDEARRRRRRNDDDECRQKAKKDKVVHFVSEDEDPEVAMFKSSKRSASTTLGKAKKRKAGKKESAKQIREKIRMQMQELHSLYDTLCARDSDASSDSPVAEGNNDD